MSTTTYPDTWRFDFADGDEIATTSLLGSQPAPTLGETGSYEFYFVADGRGDHVARYERLLDYRDHAGAYAASLSMGNWPWYSETHDGPSLLVALRPPDDSPTGRGLWGLIDNIDDSTEVPQKRCLVTVDLLYLARLSTYPDHAAVRESLEREGVGLRTSL